MFENINVVVESIGTIAFILAVISAAISFQQPKKKILLAFLILSFWLFAVQYWLAGSTTGLIIAIIIAVRMMLFYFYERKNPGAKAPFAILVIAMLSVVATGVWTWQSLFSILPIISGTIPAWGLWQNDMKTTRRTLLLGQISFLIFNLYIGMYMSVMANAVNIISIAIAMYRFDKKQ